MPSGRSIENTFNVALGIALADTTARWRHDTSAIHVEETQLLGGVENKGKRPDVLISESIAPTLVIETSYSRTDADNDAIARLRAVFVHGGVISTAFAVCIPEAFRQKDVKEIESELKAGATIEYALHQSIPKVAESDTEYRRWPISGWITGSLSDLSTFLSVAVQPREKVEEVAQQVAEIVDYAAAGLAQMLPTGAQKKVAELIQQRIPLSGLRTAMVLWLNALLIQHRLVTQEVAEADPLDFKKSGPIDPFAQADAWRRLLKRNWISIFEPAVEVLELVGSYHPLATSEALKQLINAVLTIDIARLGLYINLGAELFPLLSSDRKEAAAFYTQAGTAELLATLTIQQSYLPENEWASEQLFKKVAIGDLACGTGTLLRAGYRRVLQFHEQSGGTLDSAATLHRDAMEQGLIGTDISPVAAHLTAASLAALGTGEPYGDTRIGWVKVGGENGATGSLEYLQREQLDDLLSTFGGRSSGTNKSKTPVAVLNESVDWVLMNPPYSRTKGGQPTFNVAGLTEKEQAFCQKKWGELIRREPANKVAGMAASFLVLASKKVKPGGKIGFVLPRTAAFAYSWKSTRQMILDKFDDIVIVAVDSGTALGQDALSKDTGMEEMLLVATRKKVENGASSDENTEYTPVYSVALKSSPVQSGESTEIGRAISNVLSQVKRSKIGEPLFIGTEEIGLVDVKNFRTGQEAWHHLGVRNSDLTDSSTALLRGELRFGDFSTNFSLPLASLESFFGIGPTHDLIGYLDGGDQRGAFKFFKITNESTN